MKVLDTLNRLKEIRQHEYYELYKVDIQQHNKNVSNNKRCNKVNYYPNCYLCYEGYELKKITLLKIIFNNILFHEIFMSFE